MTLSFAYRLLKPLLFRLDAERAHDLVSTLLKAVPPALVPPADALLGHSPAELATSFAGLSLPNPLGLAAGFDKQGRLAAAMRLLGFGHVEIGTVTPRPQPGNPRPRMFRLPESGALINRLGFNSPGMIAVAGNLRQARSIPAALPILGVNIGKNRDTPLERAVEDYLAAFVALAPLADYVAVNISSPNTPGLRMLHERAALEVLLGELQRVNRALGQPRPLLLKVSPDESPEQIEQVVGVACAAGVAGFIATNTTLARDGVGGAHAAETGGLSGRPLAARSRAAIAQIYAITQGDPPIIGVGGVASADDAYDHIRAGARLVQLYTGLVYGGPALPRVIAAGLARLLRRDGFATVADAVGADA
jgi:dihydroorotate dehydrogenase